MSSSNYRFTLNMQDEQSQVSLPVRLGDTDRKLYINIADGGKPLFLEDGCRATFFGKKADGNSLCSDCIIEDRSVIRYDFTDQTASCSGIVNCEIRLYDKNGELVTSPRFIMVVDARVVYNSDVYSEGESPALDKILGSENARLEAETLRVNAENARIANEEARISAESTRASAEVERVLAEEERFTNEGDRVSLESGRVISENGRVSAENTRVKNENERISAEEDRIVRATRADTKMAGFSAFMGDADVILPTARDIVNELMNNPHEHGDMFVCESGDITFITYSEEPIEGATKIQINSMDWIMGNVELEPNKAYYFTDLVGSETYYFTTSDRIMPETNAFTKMEDRCANAIKASASGAVIRVDDVSCNKHSVKCKVKGKNLFNTLDDYKGYDHTYADGTLYVNGQYSNKYITLTEGKTYTFSCKSTRTGGTGGGAFLRAYTEDLNAYINIGSDINKLSPTLTATMPKGYPCLRITFYGYYSTDETATGTATFTEMMLEEGDTATGYIPYLDTKTVTVSRCGKNLLPYPYSRETFNGTSVQFIINDDRSVTVKGTPTSDTQFDLATELSLPVGTYRIAGNGTNVRARILGADGSTRFSVNTFTTAEGDKVRIYVVALANTEINYTFFPMLSLGEEEVAYEDYVGTTHTPLSDGTVEGVVSLAPTMTLFTDTEGVTIEVEYNQDINVLLDSIKASLKAILDLQNSFIGGEA